MTKQEQIEEMAVIGCVRNPQAHTQEECGKCDFKQGMCNAYRHAENLYNAGYRKSEEVRKETAIDFYSEMYDFAYRTKSYYTDALNDIIAKIDETFNDFRIELESLLRKCGVEVEE